MRMVPTTKRIKNVIEVTLAKRENLAFFVPTSLFIKYDFTSINTGKPIAPKIINKMTIN